MQCNYKFLFKIIYVIKNKNLYKVKVNNEAIDTVNEKSRVTAGSSIV